MPEPSKNAIHFLSQCKVVEVNAPALGRNGYITFLGVDPPQILGHAGLEASPLRGQKIFELLRP